MKGLILAAGRGSRMGKLTSHLPKCRTELHGKELIEWEMEALRLSGISEIGIIRGYLPKTFDFNVNYFENFRWDQTNMVVSLLSASTWLENDVCIVSYSDIVYSSDAVKRLISTEGDIVISYDPNWMELWSARFENPLSDAETFCLDGNQVIEVGNKTNNILDIQGQYMGLVKYTPEGWGKVSRYLKGLSQEQRDKMDMTSLLQNLIDSGIKIVASAIQDAWYEVDSEEDLVVYRTKYTIPDDYNR